MKIYNWTTFATFYRKRGEGIGKWHDLRRFSSSCHNLQLDGILNTPGVPTEITSFCRRALRCR